MATLPALPSLQSIPSIQTMPDSEGNLPSSPLYVPPSGYYQDNNGNVVPNTTPSQTFPTIATSQVNTPSTTSGAVTPVASTSSSSPSLLSRLSPTNWLSNIEDNVFIVLGLLLIAAGIFSFHTTSTVITLAGNTISKGSKLAAKAGEVVAT